MGGFRPVLPLHLPTSRIELNPRLPQSPILSHVKARFQEVWAIDNESYGWNSAMQVGPVNSPVALPSQRPFRLRVITRQ